MSGRCWCATDNALVRSAVSPRPLIITSLRADIVPHREFALRKWFYANPLWYYHRRELAGEITLDGSFYKLVDPQLRELCRSLHEAGIRTTPSCQGHFYSRDHFQKTWDELEEEEAQIQSHGLIVRDSETQQLYLFRARTFQLPWLDFGCFYEQASVHQNKGYLGVIVPRHLHRLCCALHNEGYRTRRSQISFDGELSCVLGGSLFNVFVAAADPQERDDEWRAIFEYFADALQRSVDAPSRFSFSRRG